MRRLLAGLLGLVLLSMASTSWAWTLVQKKTIAGSATCGPTCTADFDSNTTAGNLIVIVAQWPSDTRSIGSCSGDAATGWTVIAGSLVQNATLVRGAQICYGLADGGNTASVTWTPSGGSQYWAVAFEYSGNATSSIQDKANGQASTSTQTNLTIGNLTPDTDNELLVVYAACDDAATPTFTKATNWTAVQHTGTSTYNAQADYQGFSPAGATELYITASTACTYVATGATFRPLISTARRGTLLGVYP